MATYIITVVRSDGMPTPVDVEDPRDYERVVRKAFEHARSLAKANAQPIAETSQARYVDIHDEAGLHHLRIAIASSLIA